MKPVTPQEAEHIIRWHVASGDDILRLARTVLDLHKRLEDYDNAVKHALDERCDRDEKHCACVGLLRARVRELEAKL